MGRNLNNWLRAYFEYTDDTESPSQYHFWTAATVIAAATKRQVWLEMNYFKVFPNLYTILVGPPASRKGVAAGIGIKLALLAGLKKFGDKMSGAALVRALLESTEKHIDTSEIRLCSPMILYSAELGVFFGSDAYKSGIISDLTDLYDGGDPQGKWEKETISRGKETIICPFVNMLAASTPQTLKDVLPATAIGQGFTSRIMFIYADKRRKRIPVPSWSDGQQMLQTSLVKDLILISKLAGPFTFSDEGMSTYKTFYMSRPEPEAEFDDERLQGYGSRKDIHLLKVAMILSLADKDALIITAKDINGAIDALKWMESGLGRVFAGHGSSASSQDVVRVFQQIESAMSHGFITHQELVKRNYAHLSAAELDIVLSTLRQAGAVEESEILDPQTNKSAYHYRVVDKGFIKQVKQSLPKSMKED